MEIDKIECEAWFELYLNNNNKDSRTTRSQKILGSARKVPYTRDVINFSYPTDDV